MTLGRRAAPFVFLLPMFAFGTLFFVVPLLFSLGISFTRWDSFSTPQFVGAENYRELFFSDRLFLATLANTAIFVAGTLIVGTPLALAVALAMRRSRIRTFWRAVYWLPMVMNVVAVAYVWRAILEDPYGLLNRLLAVFGLAGPGWLVDPDWAMIAVVMVFLWSQLGQDVMLFEAGIEGVDETLEHAARADGASEASVFWFVTLPLLAPTLLFVTLTNMIRGVGYFALMLVLTGGGPVNATNVAALRMYNLAFTDLRLGLASAAAYVLLAIVLLLAIVQLRLMRTGGLEGWS